MFAPTKMTDAEAREDLDHLLTRSKYSSLHHLSVRVFKFLRPFASDKLFLSKLKEKALAEKQIEEAKKEEEIQALLRDEEDTFLYELMLLDLQEMISVEEEIAWSSFEVRNFRKIEAAQTANVLDKLSPLRDVEINPSTLTKRGFEVSFKPVSQEITSICGKVLDESSNDKQVINLWDVESGSDKTQKHYVVLDQDQLGRMDKLTLEITCTIVDGESGIESEAVYYLPFSAKKSSQRSARMESMEIKTAASEELKVAA